MSSFTHGTVTCLKIEYRLQGKGITVCCILFLKRKRSNGSSTSYVAKKSKSKNNTIYLFKAEQTRILLLQKTESLLPGLMKAV